MKRIVLIYIMNLFKLQLYAQTPFPCYTMQNSFFPTYSQNTGTKYYVGNCWEIKTHPFPLYGPIILENDAQTTIRANKSIHVKEGFQAKSYSSTGFAHFTLGNDRGGIEPFIMNLGSAVVGKHKKIEIGFRMPEEIETQVNEYLADPDNYIGLNPYDPAKIKIVAEFNPQSGSGTRAREGFYYEYFTKDYSIYETANPYSNVSTINAGKLIKNNSPDLLKWRVRFAPDELGFWYGTIKIYINGNFLTDIVGINFECVASDEHGFLEVGEHKRQFKFHDDNKSYYAIGQNLTWPEDCQFLHSEFNITNEDGRVINTACGADDWISRFSTLGDAHGNFARIVFCQGNKNDDNITYKSSSEIEWEKLGDYQSRQNSMWVLDQSFDIAEQKGIFILMVPNIQDEFLGRWNDNPYRSINSLATNNPNPINDVNQTRDFFTSNKAREYYKRKLRYIHARWGYGPHLAAYEMLSEMDNWSGMSGSGIFNDDDDFTHDDDFRYKCESWQHNMYLYQKNFLNCKQLFSSSYKGGSNCWKISDYSPSPFNFLDFTSNHEYNAEKLDAFKRRGVRDKMLFDGIFQSGWDKPTNFGEMGIQNTQEVYLNGSTTPTPKADHNDIENCNEIIFHNAMWSTAFMSGFGAGIQWWTSENNGYRQLIFPALHNFFANVDFEVNDWRNHQSWKDIRFNPENNKIEVFANTTKTSQKVMGWIHQATYWWGNTIQFTCKDRNNYFNEIVANGEDDSYSNPIYFYGEKYKLTGLQLKRKYDFTYFRTTGNASVYKNETIKSNIFGQLNGRYPDNYPNSSETLWDVAFKAVLHGQTFREDSTIIEPIDTDTLLCSDDTIKIDGVFGDDIGGVKSYHWNFGNGQSSNLWHPVLVYDTAGTYLVTVIITDSIGYKDTLKQYIYKPNCEYENTRNSVINEDEILTYLNKSNSNSFNVIIRPNPFDNFIYLNEKNGHRFNYTIFDLHGKAILNSLAKANSFEIDLSEFATGMYIIKIDLESNINYYKIIKTP